MIISEKQIMQLIELFKIAIEENLTRYGKEEAEQLLSTIQDQQSEELKVIDALKDISMPQPRFKINSIAWRLNDEYVPQSIRIVDIDLSADELYQDDEGNWWVDEQLYESRRGLVEEQLAYWKEQLSQVIEQPISDYRIPKFKDMIQDFQCDHASCEEGDMRKCFKCGELFR